jgi:hypothetical protein
MNFYGNRGNPFLSWPEILHVLGYFEKKKYVYFFLGIHVYHTMYLGFKLAVV